jgi:hypothetical protein
MKYKELYQLWLEKEGEFIPSSIIITTESMKSLSLAYCDTLEHTRIRHSPDGVDIIEECPECCKAWLIKAGTGEEIRLIDSSYETRLVNQRLASMRKLADGALKGKE